MMNLNASLQALAVWIEQQQNDIASTNNPNEYSMGKLDALQDVLVEIAERLHTPSKPPVMTWENSL